MAQHFLLSKQARTLSLAKVMRLSDDEAYETFKAIRWSENDGEPICPRCGCVDSYEYRTRKIYKCAGCHSQYSLTTGTIFASRKMSLRDLLAAIAIFVNGAKGISALQLSRDLDCQYKTAFVLAHKLREAMASEMKGKKLQGTVEIDGAYFGGHIKPANKRLDRIDRRLKKHQTGKRKAVVVMREREGNAKTTIHKEEGDAVPVIQDTVVTGSTIMADEGAGWDDLHARYDMERINHTWAYSADGACTNQAESFFSRLRRAEIGTHHHISGDYLDAYADEMAWRENNRRKSNGEQFEKATRLAITHPVSRKWKGYWQRSNSID